jgi:TonB family protein
MKAGLKITLLLLVFSIELMSQTACDQYIALLKKATTDGTSRDSREGGAQKRSFRMSSQIKNDKNINYTECDTLGRIHFWGNIGSLKIESYYADGKRYSKIQSEYVKEDEWTFQDIKLKDAPVNTAYIPFIGNTQTTDCQIVGEEIIKNKNCKILSFTNYKKVPKRNSMDSFMMEIKVKMWFCAADSLAYKYVYETNSDRLSQVIQSTIEYDVPVKIELPRNAKMEVSKILLASQNNTNNDKKSDSAQLNEAKLVDTYADLSRIKDTAATFSKFDQSPEYKDGMSALLTYITQNMHYPEEARKAGVDGTVYVNFIVETNGKLTAINIKRGLRPDVDAEALRIVESMSGAWKAGKVSGKNVRSAYTLPLKFELRE